MSAPEQSEPTDEPETPPGNLPVQITALVGRETALDELGSLLWRTRLLTLCGPGGAGKSRLAGALAEAARPDFVGGAWWADLTACVDDDLVAQSAAAAILPGSTASDPTAGLAQQLAAPALLVLDNCEQVATGTARLAVELLGRCPALRIVATSRQPLGVSGEQVWRVDGLELGDFGAGAASTLFVQRAREATAAFDTDAPSVRRDVARICRWLDGLPLAIELAAARVPVLGVGQIAERLERDGALLRQSNRAAPGRHRTLQDTLEWSHQLLEPDEQRLFGRLAAFRGTFSLAAAEAVCADENLPAAEILDLLSRLIDRSLVQVVDGPGPPRYRLLSIVRQYAAAKLGAGEELPGVCRRHAEMFHDLSLTARRGLTGADQVRWLEELELEHDNLSEAQSWLLANDPARAAEMASALWPFLYQHGYYSEARHWFEQLAEAPGLDTAARIDTLLKAGEVTFLVCDYPAALGHLERALELTGAGGEPRELAIAHQRLGSIAREQGRYEDSRRLHERSLELFTGAGDSAGVASTRSYLCFMSWLSEEFDEAERNGTAALTEFRHLGDLREVAAALVNLGATASYRGDHELAAQRLEEALAISRRLGYQEAIAWSLHELAILGRRRRRAGPELELMLRDALLTHQQLGDRWRQASVLEEIGGSALARRDPGAAVSLLAAATALRERIGTPVPPAEAEDRTQALERLRRRLPAGAFSAAWEDGLRLTPDQAVDLAVTRIESDEADGDGDSMAPILTPRELAVLELLSQGHTNREIAATLYISPSTAGVHVSNILRKLRAKRRVDAAGRAHTLGLLPTANPA